MWTKPEPFETKYLTTRGAIIRAMLKRSEFRIFSAYLDTLHADGYILADLIGDPHKFLGMGEYNRDGSTLMVGVGSEGSYAIYSLSFKTDLGKGYVTLYPDTVCQVTGATGTCYAYHMELVDKGYNNNHQMWIPHITFGANLRYEGVEFKLGSAQGYQIPGYRMRYGVPDKNWLVGASHLEVLTVDGTYEPIMNYARMKHGIPAFAKTDEGVPMLVWNVCWIENYWHKWGAQPQNIPPYAVQKKQEASSDE